MKKGCLYFEDDLNLFEIDPFFKKLQNEFKNKKDVDFQLKETNSPSDSDFIFYYNMPTDKVQYPEKSYVWIAEPPVIYKRNFKKSKYKNFKKIFCWDKNLIDGKKFIKLNYPQNFCEIDFNLEKKEKLCCIFARNKVSKRLNELFSKRQEAILWFKNNAPSDFDLFGIGWDKGLVQKKIFLTKKYDVSDIYKGQIDNKIERLSKYKFSICFENWKNKRGYVTEKIFDAFKASNVPVYFGCLDIKDYVPENCFIDLRDFKNYNDLYKYMKNMKDDEYLNYLKNIQEFLKSDKAYEFSADKCVNTIIEEIL